MRRSCFVLLCTATTASAVFAQVNTGKTVGSTLPLARVENANHPFPVSNSAYVKAPAGTPAAATSVPPSPATIAPPPSPLTLHTHVSVQAHDEGGLSTLPPSTVEFTGKDVLESAGTWSDLPRYLQTLPGMISGADSQNASFVRGGNSFENLFVVDRIEVPNINHLALANSTGGLGSMLDTEMVGNVSFQSGDFGSSHDSRLSSLTDIRTLETPDRSFTAFDLGYSGAGVRASRAVGARGSLLFSARESVTNLFLKDVGLNGSPEFTNGFARYTLDLSARDHLWVESLAGRDTLQVRPTWNDNWETNAYDTNYSGWRNTTGFVWQHTLHNEAVSSWTLSNSENSQHLQQTSQLEDTPSSFLQNTHDGASVLKYDYQYADENGSGSQFGGDVHLNRVNYSTAQAGDIFSPYSAGSLPTPAFSLAPSFSTMSRAAFMDVNQSVRHRLFIRAGMRLQNTGNASGQGSETAYLPHGSVSLAVKWLNLRASYNRSAQLPPYATIAGAPGNTSLGLIHAQQFITGGSVQLNGLLTLNVEGYRKLYTGYPVSVDYPQVSLATLLPVITEPFAGLSMRSEGKGRTQGVEVSVAQAPRHGFFTRANVTLSRAEFTGTDGIYRAGTNDLPIVVNVLGGAQWRRYTITARETASSGRPFTPVLPQASYDANRSIYDLSQLNALRGPLYNRLDLAVNREMEVRNGVLRIHAGLLNVLNRENFYEYLWRPRCPVCGPVAEYGTGLRPDVNVSFTF